MNLVHALQQQTLNNPDKPAYHFMGKDTSYKQFDEMVCKLSNSLAHLGVKKGDHVAFLLGNTPHFLIALYATMRVGATAIPINPIFTADEISYIVKNSDAKAVIALDVLLPLLEKVHQDFTTVNSYIICETSAEINESISSLQTEFKQKVYLFAEQIQKYEATFDAVQVENNDTAVILYTSGTTGRPKGAMLTHENLFSNARDIATYLNYSSNDRVIATLPVFHVFALTVVVNAPLLSGGTVLLVPKFTPQEVFKIASEQKATVFAGVPTMYNFLFQLAEGNVSTFETIRLAISGGASLPVALLQNFENKFNVRISEGYGLSEASPVVCFNPLNRERKPGSIGTAISNVEAKVVNELGEELPVGEVGELIARGPNIMKGYYKMLEESAATIRNGWLYTGDLAKQDEEGYFYIVDRKKDLVIVGGYNVYPREVEEVLFAHEGIVEAAVIGVPDEEFGEAVVAYVVKKDDSLTEDAVIAYCKEHLAKYKTPRKIEFLSELPKNTTGKILRRSLKDIVLAK